MEALAKAIRNAEAYYCLDCGKCTSVCPVSRYKHGFSPRSLLIRALRDGGTEVLDDTYIWACLACGLCSETCPSGIDFTGVMKGMRLEAGSEGRTGECSHGGALHSLQRIMTSPPLRQNRLDWVTKDLRVKTRGEVGYFVGCAPYLDIYFTNLEVGTLKGAEAAVKLLNRIGIEPVLHPEERCCGHDLLWSGDRANFEKLAQSNVKAFQEAGVKKLVFSCPEGLRTFRLDYPEVVGELPFEVVHITEVLADALARGELSFKGSPGSVTFQDPCRLGRHLNIYEPPRVLIERASGGKLIEMARAGQRAICCGVNAWLDCDSATKAIQRERLRQAEETGAEALLVACPKCEIHFKCAQQERAVSQIPVKDLMSYLLEALK